VLVIVHGWSDSAESFDNIANRLVGAGVPGPVTAIQLADYITLDDNVTYRDLVEAMDRAWTVANLPRAPRSVDVVCHSTGALVVRDWMTSVFKDPASNPILRLVMLAPANFGSPLATTGQSFIGRVVKGFHSGTPFQTGTHILKGLELASPYSWNLALRDRFDATKTWYGPGRVLCTVLVGTDGYTGIRAIANSPGSDGTVRVSTANLNPVYISVNFASDPQNPIWTAHAPIGRTAFCRLLGENHGSIAQGGSAGTLKLIVDALATEDITFDHHCDALQALSGTNETQQQGSTNTQGYQNTVVRVTDDLGQPVTDYLIEAYVPKGDSAPTPDDVDEPLTQFVQEHVLTDVHNYTADASFRALLFNCTQLKTNVTSAGRKLDVSITAHPQVEPKSAGYSTFGYDDIGAISLTPAEQQQLFGADRTVLIDLVIRRDISADLYVFRPSKQVAPVP